HLGATGFLPLSWWDWLEAQYFYREASELIDGTPPVDVRLLVLRARAFAGLRWTTKADAEYAKALKLKPEDPQIRLAAHRTRVYLCFALRYWSQAAAEFAQASDLRPGDVRLWQYRALAYLAAGDLKGYRQACATMLEHFATAAGPEAANDV